MKSLNTSIRNMGSSQREKAALFRAGFTLLEILVVMGLFSLVIGIGMSFSLDSYRNYLLRSETEHAYALLTQARNRAVNNFNEDSHIFAITSSEYRVYPAGDSSDPDVYPRNDALTITPDTITIEFEQLSGNVPDCSPSCDIILTNGLLTRTITINEAGGILIN